MKAQNTSWMFEVDKVHLYAYQKKLFSKEECKKIIKIGKDINLIDGKVTQNHVKDEKIRDSKISWIFPSEDTTWIFKKLTDSLNFLNKTYFKFDIYGLVEGLQFTNYKAPNGHYGVHVDSEVNTTIRKLSVTVQLSDPNEYKGGNLNLINGPAPFVAEKEQGMVYCFPSYVLHEVTPVTKGERSSLVCWVTGPSFK